MSRRRFLRLGFLSTFTLLSTGCATILHPERKGQPHGPLDWKMVALDAVGLIFFFVPGVIAFAVDFNNGSIYLPPDHYGESQPPGRADLTEFAVPRRQLSLPDIEQTVSSHLQRPVQLVPGQYQTQQLENIDQFWTVHDSHAS